MANEFEGTGVTWGTRTLWVTSVISSLLLLALIVAQVDWTAAGKLAKTINYFWAAAGIALQMLEGTITALRFRLLSRTQANFRDCLRASAWYVMFLIALPVRLGEVAGIALIVRYLGERTGAAAASLLFQRLFDLIFLVAALVVFCVSAFVQMSLLVVVTLVFVVLGLVAIVVFLEHLLAFAVRPLLVRRKQKWPRRILRIVLQVRMVRRHHMDRMRTIKLAALTLLKWIATLGAVVVVVIAAVPNLSPTTAFGIGIVYNLSALIPIQTVGGFGISEAALLGSFGWLGYPLGIGASIAIAIRIVLLAGPLLFWLIVIVVLDRRAVTPTNVNE
jgi:uncharacterized membrane protein YbhN (UPF0104 family)